MYRERVALLFIFVAVVNPVAAQSVQAVKPDSFVGCYALTLGKWTSTASWQELPAIFRLDTLPADNRFGPGWRQAAPNSPFFASSGTLLWRPGPMWRAVTADSVEVSWSTGFVGTALALKAGGDTLKGVARSFTDVRFAGKVDPSTTAIAVRRPCPTELR